MRNNTADKNESGAEFKTTIGGQALLEGILMRGPSKQCIAVRTKDGIVKKTTPLRLTKDRHKAAGFPFIRGVINFGASMTAGVRALMYSAEFIDVGDDEPSESKFDKWIEKKLGGENAEKVIVAISVVFGIGLSVLLFMLLPTVIAGFATRFTEAAIVKNLIEGLLRIIIFVAYIGLTSMIPDMKRVWKYHGAEHKTIFCYEKNLPLTVENARIQPRCHPRCGTSFMLIVMVVSILVFSVFRWQGVLFRIVSRLLLLPVVVAVSYELIRWTGRHDNAVTRVISAPGKALQRLTTSEPDDSMLEVALAALAEVLPETDGADKW
ncbi:MAG: DUF1385 domain-containing protein [Oscillospiraceae bacterium]|nr:DUF1385 domain-containing protein [Oscillospiraceae bacterium]